jgi:lipoate-protein ligase A
MNLKINYNEQMLNYYPEVIKSIKEFQRLIETQSLEVEEMHEVLTKTLENAYISSADESTIKKWEQYLGITPLPQGEDSMETWLADRRETILARLYKTPKLNTNSIADIVKIFTGGTAVSYFKNGTIYVLITPPKDNKQYKFVNVEQELENKIPAHLQLNVARNYFSWNDIKKEYPTWGDIKDSFENWEELVLYVPFK